MTGGNGVRPAGTERTLLGRAVLLTVLVGALAASLAGALRGLDGMLGSVLAVALVLGFLLLGQVPVAQVARGRRGLGAALLIALYTLRVLLLLVAYRVVVANPGTIDRGALGLTVVAAALGWTAGAVWSALRWRPLVVEPDPPGEQR